ncbi:hypothetical protein D3C78_1609480 [compost metagenome]
MMLGRPLADLGIDVPAHRHQPAVLEQRMPGRGDETTANVQHQPALMGVDKRRRIESAQRYHAVIGEPGTARHQLSIEA